MAEEVVRKSPFEAYGVECGKGWEPLVKPLIDLCKLYDVTVMQVKEKFGGLRFYVMGERADELFPVIGAVEEASYHMCEDCGETGIKNFDPVTCKPVYKVSTSSSKTSGWIRTLCESCRIAWDAQREAKA